VARAGRGDGPTLLGDEGMLGPSQAGESEQNEIDRGRRDWLAGEAPRIGMEILAGDASRPRPSVASLADRETANARMECY